MTRPWLAILLVVGVASASGFGVVACGGTSAVDSFAGSGDGGGDASSSGDGGARGSDCGAPAVLPGAAEAAGVVCPFSGATSAQNVTCTTTEECCEVTSGSGGSACALKGTACANASSIAWECDGPSDCLGSRVCCARAAVAADACGAYLSGFAGTRCASGCGDRELVVCAQQSDCPRGTCTAVAPYAKAIGVCN